MQQISYRVIVRRAASESPSAKARLDHKRTAQLDDVEAALGLSYRHDSIASVNESSRNSKDCRAMMPMVESCPPPTPPYELRHAAGRGECAKVVPPTAILAPSKAIPGRPSHGMLPAAV